VIGGRTRLFVILGQPVAHSLSPAMQNAAFRALGLDAVYAALECRRGDVASTAAAIARAGGGGNATVPHKETLAQALERPSDRVRKLGSANTFWGEGDALAGDSTDVDGVLDALHRIGAPATAWGIAGTGGSARAVIGAAAERAATVAILSRDPARATELTDWAKGLGVGTVPLAESEVLINATPLGLGTGDPLPFAGAATPRATHALDLVYRAKGTPWVADALRRGLRAEDGRAMLVAQGAAALERWFPKVRAPREVMHAAVERALG
jgi:shikimate dehydrogenase